VRKLTMDEWERKYIAHPIEQFDQKNTVFLRASWDREIRERLDSWSFIGEASEKPGYTLEDQALRWAARRGTQLLALLNTSKPNPSAATREVAKAIRSARPAGRTLSYRPPEGAQLDVGDGQEITGRLKKVARWFGADLVGICRLDRRWLYSHTFSMSGSNDGSNEMSGSNDGEHEPQVIPDEFKSVVVLGFEMDYDMIKYYPSFISGAATSMGYSQMAVTNLYLSAFIRNLGYKAIDCTTNDVALSVPMAMQAGLGDIARNGLLVTPKYGPRVRISKIITDLPLVPDAPIDFGVTEFCDRCKICADKCPAQCISPGERTIEPRCVSNLPGIRKWPIQPEACRMYWGRVNRPCTTCIACCPYNKPDTLFHRAVRWCTDHARWGDPIYVKLDVWSGYGKPENPAPFWDRWRPSSRNGHRA